MSPRSGRAMNRSPTGASITRLVPSCWPGSGAMRAVAEGARLTAAAGRLARAEQVLHRHAERLRERERHAQRRVGVPRLDRGHRLPAHPGHGRELLLREPAHLAGEPQVGPGTARCFRHEYGW